MSCAVKIVFACLWLAMLSSRAETLHDGNIAFAKGDYPAAVRAFEAALNTQGPDAGTYFNLAVAQQKNGERARAALNFRRAIMLDPRIVDARIALSEIERSQGVPAGRRNWRESVSERVPLHGLQIAGCTLIWLGAFLLLFFTFIKRGRFYRPAGAIGLIFIGAGIFTIGYLADPRVFERNMAVVSPSEGITLLTAPADQSAAVLRLPSAAPLRMLGRSGDWTFCSAPGGERGWAPSKSLEAVVPTT
jgi:tetratricopeptide (TPR) repeat protein